MAAPEFTPLEGQPRKTRWIDAPFGYEDLRDKRIFAQFTTQAGDSYQGTGEIRVRRNSQGRLAIDLAFTRVDSPYQFTDIIFHLSTRQAQHLQKAPVGAGYQFVYEGHLTPDNRREPS